VIRGAVTLLDETRNELYIEASAGIDAEGQQARYQLGEGITGRVVESGRPVVVANAAREPLFLHRTARRPDQPGEEITFVCVPILLDLRPVGALAVDLPYRGDRDHDHLLKFLDVVTSLIGLALMSPRPVDAERQSLREENSHLRLELRERYDFSQLIGASGPMRDVQRQITQVTGTGTTVLLRGESGTGKELIARAIHYHSPRAEQPFVAVNCAALPESLIESELFGHEKGAFTGALARRKGRFELADGGTLLLDEIGELRPATQVKLLRVLQEREFERLGGHETIRVDVRVIAATNKDLEKAIAEGAFREDLYYRLNVFPIFVPPLRDRKSDLLQLADHFVEKFSRLHGRPVKRITTPAIDMLVSYHWPGNVRELENTISRLSLFASGPLITLSDLARDPDLLDRVAELPGGKKAPEPDLRKDDIKQALKATGGNKVQAAALLGISRATLFRKIRQFQIKA
jgi:Nif-specific regulatory protein